MKMRKNGILFMCVMFCSILFSGCEKAECVKNLTLEQLREECTNGEDLILRATESDNICVIKSEKLINGKKRLNDFFINVKRGVKDYVEFVDIANNELVCNQNASEITEKYYPKNAGKFKAYNHSAEIIGKGNLSDEEFTEEWLKRSNLTSSSLGDITISDEPLVFLYIFRLDFDGEKFMFSNNVIKYDWQNDIYIGVADDPVEIFVFEQTDTNLYIETYSTEIDEKNADISRYVCWLFKNATGKVVKAVDWFE